MLSIASAHPLPVSYTCWCCNDTRTNIPRSSWILSLQRLYPEQLGWCLASILKTSPSGAERKEDLQQFDPIAQQHSHRYMSRTGHSQSRFHQGQLYNHAPSRQPPDSLLSPPPLTFAPVSDAPLASSPSKVTGSFSGSSIFHRLGKASIPVLFLVA